MSERVATLRVGVPSARRWNLLFTCDAPATAPQRAPRLGSAPYARDSLDASGRHWRRIESEAAADSAGALAPDTLIVIAYDEATDQEIAIERGELDVAVFWPGELSARMRLDARVTAERGLRSRGLLACVAGAGDTLGAPQADLDALNREAFAGDLLPWSELEAQASAALDPPPARYAVDATVPGAKHLERILARIARPGAARSLKLVYFDQPLVTGASGRPEWRTTGVTPLFAVRCPVLARGSAVQAVHAIGAGAFAELAPCAGGTRR